MVLKRTFMLKMYRLKRSLKKKMIIRVMSRQTIFAYVHIMPFHNVQDIRYIISTGYAQVYKKGAHVH